MKKLLLLMQFCFMMVLLNAIPFNLSAQKTFSGLVTDNDGNPLPGVTIVIKGTTDGTITDLDGKYILIVPNEKSVLVFSFVGYSTQEASVEGKTSITIKLAQNVKDIEEIIVIGYGSQKRTDLTGAVTSVNASELTKIPVTGVENALQGKAAGVQVSQNTGAPGSNVKIRVRGISSLNGGDPKWIVDGVPAGANSVNTNDIESIEILKDASSAAIYGADGGNGVILITTKKGKAGKPVASVNLYHGFQYVPNRLEMASSSQFGAMYTEFQAIQASGGNIEKLTFPNYKTMPTYNYQDMIFRTALMDNIDFNVSGGNDKLAVYFGMGLTNQEGILKSSNYKKLNVRLNSDYKVNDWFKVGENLSFTHTKTFGWEEWEYNSEYGSPITAAITVHPYLAPYDSTGNWVPRTFGNTDDPMASIDLMNKEYRNYIGNGAFFCIIEPLKGLTIESRISGGISFGDNYNFSPVYRYGSSLGQFNDISKISRSMNKYFNYNWQNIISYNRTFLTDFNFGLVAGYEVGASESMDISGLREKLLTQAPEMWYFNASTDSEKLTQLVTGGGSKSANYSYLGRLSLDYKGKYLFQGNFRRDYSSRFGPNNRYGNFPGISVGWKFSEENFIKDRLGFLSFGKIRYAYGKAGNSAIRDYAYYGTVAVLQSFKYSFDNTKTLSNGAGPDVLPNLSIHWEDIVSQNYGIDLAFFNSKLNLTVDRYERHNVGMLVYTTIPGFAGWTVRDTYQESANVDPRPIQNVGKITNKGWEFSLGWKDAVGKFNYGVDVNYSYNKNEATDLGTDSVRMGGGFLGMSNLCRTVTGGELGNFYGYKIEKIFQESDAGTLPNGKPGITNQPSSLNAKGETVYMQATAQPGDFKFADLNGDGRLTDKDQAMIGNPFPKHIFGVNINLEYGWFDLSMFWQGTVGNKIFNAAKYYGLNQSGLYNWSVDYIDNHYRSSEIIAKNADGNVVATFPANTGAKYPRLDPLNRNGNFDRISDFYVEDGSYMRLKNIQLGVSIPDMWIKKLSLSQLRVYVGAKNFVTFTKYSGMDPEVTQSDPLVSGIDKSAYPQARAIIFGASVKF